MVCLPVSADDFPDCLMDAVDFDAVRRAIASGRVAPNVTLNQFHADFTRVRHPRSGSPDRQTGSVGATHVAVKAPDGFTRFAPASAPD
jgi:hypothetical protein